MVVALDEDRLRLRAAGRAVRACLVAMRAAALPGVTTARLDAIAARVMREHGARPAPALVYGFPAATCISVNDEVVHGIPSARRLADGDLLKLDVTVEKNERLADAAITVNVGRGSDEGRRLIACTGAAFRAGWRAARAGRRTRDVGRAIESAVKAFGFTPVHGLSGHGIGRSIHEPPTVPNVDDPNADDVLVPGLVITIEPIVTSGSGAAFEDSDRWTIRTTDGRLAAHHEHTLIVTAGDPLLVTAA